jgi:hypothetical protein
MALLKHRANVIIAQAQFQSKAQSENENRRLF